MILDYNKFESFKYVSGRLCFFISLALVSFLLSACSGTGGVIGGLIPAPKLLKGTVEDGAYMAPEGAFSIKLPYSPEGSVDEQYEWRYAKVHEIQDKGKVEGVILGPHAFDRNLYHAVLVYMKIGDDPVEYVDYVIKRKLDSRNQNAVRKHFEYFKHSGSSVYYAVYEAEYSYIVFSFVDFEDRYVVLEVDVEKREGREDIRPSLNKLIKREWDKYNAMLDSLQVPVGSVQ